MKKPYSSLIAHRLSLGFTLIEVMLVVVIILIIAGVAVPKFKGTFKSTQMADTVRSTVRLARYARSLAVLQQEACVLRFEPKQMVLLCGTNRTVNTSRTLPEGVTIRSFENLSGGGRESAAEREIWFYAAGMNDGFKVTFGTEDDRRATIVCNPVSGKVVVEEEFR